MNPPVYSSYSLISKYKLLNKFSTECRSLWLPNVLYILWEGLMFSFSLILLFSNSFAHGSSLDLAFPSFHFFSSPLYSEVPRPIPLVVPKLQIPLISCFLWQTSSVISSPPLLQAFLGPPKTHTLFSSTIRTNYLCHECYSCPESENEPWFFFLKSNFSQYTENIISLTSTYAFPLYLSIYCSLCPELPIHSSQFPSWHIQLQISLRHHCVLHLICDCWLNKYINYVFSTLKNKWHSFPEKIFRKNRPKFTWI